jgi:hypothetical protein
MFAAFGLRKKFKFPDRPFWIFAILFFAVIAFGPDMRLAPGLEFPSPLYRFLHEYVPGFQATRAPSRFFVGGMMGLVLIAANGFASLTAKFNSSARLMVTLAALVVLGGEYLAIPVRTSPIETGTALPAVYQWLQKQPPGNVVELPLAIGEVLPVTRSMYFSLYHRRSLPIAYASFLPPTQVDVLHTLNTALETPSPRVPNLLREFNVRYVIVNRGVENSAAVEAALGRAPGLESVYEDETNRVFRVTPEAPLHPLQFGCLAPQYAVPNAPYTLYLTAAHNRRYPVVNGELTPITVLVEWRQGDTAQATQSQTVRLPYVLPEREVGVPVTVNAPQSDGDVLVTCKLQDGTQIGESLPVRVVPDLQTGELPPPLELLAVRFGQEVSRESGEIVATFFWRRRTAVSDPLAMRARLVKDDGTVVSEVEREPVLYMHPVRLWHDNELVADSIALPIPPDTAPGEYRIEISVIDRRTGAPAVFRNLEGKPATGFSGQPLTLY